MKHIGRIFLLYFLLFSISCVYSDTLEFKLNTKNPTQEPYFVGTQITSVELTILDSANKPNLKYDFVDIKLGQEPLRLFKKNNSYVSNKSMIISNADVKSNQLLLKVDTLLENVSNNIKTYRIKTTNDYIGYEVKNLKNVYNIGQDLNLVFEYNLRNASSITCSLLSPDIRDNKINCSNNLCSKELKVINNNNGKFNYDILCLLDSINEKVPLRITKDLELSNELEIEFVNPNLRTVENPFLLEFKLKYKNGEYVKSRNLKFEMDDTPKNLYLSNNTYSINYLLIPYTTFDKKLKFIFEDTSYIINTNIKLKPDYWFWLLLLFFLIIIISNIVILSMKILKKENLNELIVKRDMEVKKLEDLKSEFMKGKIIKSKYEKLFAEYTLNISSYNASIMDIKGSNKNDHLKQIDDIKKDNVIEPPKSLSNALKSLKKDDTKLDTPKKEEKIEPKDKKKNFFENIFNVKKEETLDDKIETIKKDLKKKDEKDDDEFDISSWKK